MGAAQSTNPETENQIEVNENNNENKILDGIFLHCKICLQDYKQEDTFTLSMCNCTFCTEVRLKIYLR